MYIHNQFRNTCKFAVLSLLHKQRVLEIIVEVKYRQLTRDQKNIYSLHWVNYILAFLCLSVYPLYNVFNDSFIIKWQTLLIEMKQVSLTYMIIVFIFVE